MPVNLAAAGAWVRSRGRPTADLILVSGDPLADAATLAEPANVVAVIKGGGFVVTRGTGMAAAAEEMLALLAE